MDERKWIESILAGDMQRFSCLISKYEKMAFTLAFRIVGNREEAEEVTQDAFLKMYQALPDFRFESKFSSWFYRIVYRTALSAIRRQSLFTDVEDVDTSNVTVEEQEQASALLEQNDRKKVIQKTLKELPKSEALLLTLFYLQECTIDEISQITGLSNVNVKTKLFRARKHFYSVLEKEMKNEIKRFIMKQNNQSLDQLTRRLMEESIEQPSSNLDSRIMGLLRKEQQIKKKTVSFSSLPSAENIIWGMVVYLMVVGAFFYLSGGNIAEMKETIVSVVDHYALGIVTISAGTLLFSLCLWTDNRRKWRMKRS